MNTTSGTAAVYVRISDDPESTRLGVQRQEQDCRQLAKRLGWTVAEVYEDNDLSASKAKVTRLAYQRLLKDIKAGTVTRLAVYTSDRLYRQPRELEDLIDLIEENHVAIASVRSGDIDLTTADGRADARMKGVWSKREAEKLSERVQRKMDELRAAGSFTGGPRPFGWKVVGGQFIELPKEIALLREAATRVLAGETIHAIVRDFQKRGVTTPRGKHIQDTALLTMLTSHRMIGMTAAGVRGGWKALATADEYARLKLILRTKTPGKRREVSGKYLVTGAHLICGLCGGPMYGAPTSGGKPVPTYACKPLVAHNGCGRVAIKVDTLDARVMEAVAEHLTGVLYPPKVHGKRLPSTPRKIDTSPKLADAALAMARVQKQSDDLAVLAGQGQISASEWITAKRELAPRLSAAQKGLEAAQATAAGLNELAALDTVGFVKNWRAMDTPARRKVVLAVVAKIRVQPHKGAFQVADFERVSVEFKPV